MSNNQFALRKISFPFTPDTFETISIPAGYLAYLPAYSTTLLLYGSTTRLFNPGDMILESEINISDVNSPNYNTPTIDGYVSKNIFTRIPLYQTSTTGVAGEPIDPAIFNMTTIGVIIPEIWDPGGHFDIPVQSSFLRDGLLYQWSRYSTNGDGEFPILYEYDTATPNSTSFVYDVTYDSGDSWSSLISNPVVDSLGNIIAIKMFANIGNPANADFYLTGFNSMTSTVDISRAGCTPILMNQSTSIIFRNILIDSADNIYLCATYGLYKVIEDVLTLIATPVSDFTSAEYNATTNTILANGSGFYYEYSTVGALLNTSSSMTVSYPTKFATGMRTVMVQYQPQDGAPDFVVSTYLDDTNGTYIPSNNNDTPMGFVDGNQTECELSSYHDMVIKYDSEDPDIYFIDGLPMPGR